MSTFLTPREVGQKWGMSARHIRRLCADGSLRAMRLGLDAWRISLDDVTAYELRRANTSAAEPVQPSAPKTQEVRPPVAIDGFTLPADYEPVFKDLWPGHVATTQKATSQRH